MTMNELRRKTVEEIEESIFNLDMKDSWTEEDNKYNDMLHQVLKEKEGTSFSKEIEAKLLELGIRPTSNVTQYCNDNNKLFVYTDGVITLSPYYNPKYQKIEEFFKDIEDVKELSKKVYAILKEGGAM